MTRLWNFVTFQVWAVTVLAGILISFLTQSTAPVPVAAGFGFLLGVVINEMLGGGSNEGIRLVPESDR